MIQVVTMELIDLDRDGIPYKNLVKQEGFGNYGGPHILSLVNRSCYKSLKNSMVTKVVRS